ncbi:MAG: glycosyltransferase family 4 protein [Gammaproteobacteria bacterium]
MAFLLTIVAVSLSAYLTKHFINPLSRFHYLDHPNERSLHSMPVPRTGGLAICITLVSVCPASLYFFDLDSSVAFIGIGAISVALVSYMDDQYSLSASIRFAVHAFAALILLVGGLYLKALELPLLLWSWPTLIGLVFSFLFVVWMVNLYNFMDGMDGFAGGMSIFGFASFAIMGWIHGDWLFCSLSLTIVGSVTGFLYFNFPPAKIFMGDTGSSTLGFLVAAFSLWANKEGIFTLWIGVLVFSPFVVDATVTLLRRFVNRENILQAHRSHYYQRLVLYGWGHQKTVIIEYILMFCCSVSAITARFLPGYGQLGIILAWILIYLCIIARINRLKNSQGLL